MAKYSAFELVYYSGTGCTKLAAEYLYAALTKAGCEGSVHRIMAMKEENPGAADDSHLFVLLFPVHSFNAPEAVYVWLQNLSAAKKRPAVVIDVSGGGRVCPNRAVRMSCIKRLEQKGFDVIYEDSLVMPSNFLVPTNEKLAVRLLEVLPEKTEQIAENILAGTRRREKPALLDRLASRVGELEKAPAKDFGAGMKVSESCNDCGWCAGNCPAGNISMKYVEYAEFAEYAAAGSSGPVYSKPVFGRKCHLCLCCVYGCPERALSPKKYKFIVIKDGFSIPRLKELPPTEEDLDINELAKGYIWSGVRKYLTQKSL